MTRPESHRIDQRSVGDVRKEGGTNKFPQEVQTEEAAIKLTNATLEDYEKLLGEGKDRLIVA